MLPETSSALPTVQGDSTNAQPRPSPGVVQHPDWIAKPSWEDVDRFYPWLAQEMGVGGAARMQCTVSTLGALEDCRVIQVRPGGVGFRKAALSLAPYFRMRPKMVDGVPTEGGSVIVPIRFGAEEFDDSSADQAGAVDPRRLAAARRMLARYYAAQNPAERWKRLIDTWLKENPEDPLDAPPSGAVKPTDAIVQAVHAAQPKMIEREAPRLARALTLAQLESISRFLSSPAGKALLAYQEEAETIEQQRIQRHLVQTEARRIFCASTDCGERPHP